MLFLQCRFPFGFVGTAHGAAQLGRCSTGASQLHALCSMALGHPPEGRGPRGDAQRRFTGHLPIHYHSPCHRHPVSVSFGCEHREGNACAPRSPGGRQCMGSMRWVLGDAQSPRPQARSTPSAGSLHVLVDRVATGFCWYVSSTIAGGATDRLQQPLQPVVCGGSAAAGQPHRPVHPSSNSACPAPLNRAPLPARSAAPTVCGRRRASASATPLGNPPISTAPLSRPRLRPCTGTRLPCQAGARCPCPSLPSCCPSGAAGS